MQDLTQAIRDKYGAVARAAATPSASIGCCSDTCGDPISTGLYSDAERGALPAEAVSASLGCGNPTGLASLEPGQTVLDLGAGGGIDVLLSAKRVGPAGKVYGLDMTEDMVALARENQRRAGATNVEFLLGAIESIPLPDRTVDVIVSNCVINLSADKNAVFCEAFRVLKPGGRLAISDVVVRGAATVPDDIRRRLELWIGCVSGALNEEDYVSQLRAAGFEDVDVDPWRIYTLEDARQFLLEGGFESNGLGPALDGRFMSAFVRATKPLEASPCCGSGCCK